VAEHDSRNVLTADESKILAAIADRIFPRTETPGAVEIGALQYVEVARASSTGVKSFVNR
jgi:hypothetical protein